MDRKTAAELFEELATRERAGGLDPGLWLGSMPDPDPVLRKRGEYATVLDELTADEQVCTAMQQRKLQTLLRGDYDFSPGRFRGEQATAEAEALCKALVTDLERVDIYNLISEVLDAPYYGYTVAELLWEPGGLGAKLRDVVVKPRRWFGWGAGTPGQSGQSGQPGRPGEPLFVGEGGLAEARPLHPHKFVLARHFPTYDNPYGLRLLSRCLWPVAFKKAGVRWWARFCEKYGLPHVIGEALGRMERAEREQNAAMLKRMVEDAVAVVSGLKLHVLEAKHQGELHKTYVEYWDAAMAKVLVGQTLSSDVGKGGGGTYAQAQAHLQVLDSYAAADARLVTTFFTDLAWVYGQVNRPGVLTPTFGYPEPEDLERQARLDKSLHDTGVRFKKSHYVGRYGLAEEDFELAEEAEEARAPGAGGVEFAAQDQTVAVAPVSQVADSQELLDGLVDGMLDQAGELLQEQADSLAALLARAESYEDARLLLAEALGPDDEDPLAEQLLNGMLNAALLGRWSVEQELSEPGARGDQA